MERFRSEVSVGLLAIPVLALALAPLAVIGAVPRSEQARAVLILSVALFPVVVFIVWMYLTTDYRVEGNELMIRSGPFRWRVDLKSVGRLRATRSPLSAPALSFNRIEVEYGQSSILVSPADRRGFIRAILTRAPNVSLEGLDAHR